MILPPKRSVVPLLLVAAALGVGVNLPWLMKSSGWSIDSKLLQQIDTPIVQIIGSSVAVLLALLTVLRLISMESTPARMARLAERRGDFVGAADMYLQTGDTRRAFKMFKKGRAWSQAARSAMNLNLHDEAAALYRRAGARHLSDAARVYRQIGNRKAARRCDHELAEWLMSEENFEEAIEAWLRAGETERAVRATNVALNENRLLASHPTFAAARRAAEKSGNHTALARLFELESDWEMAAGEWREAGEHAKAAESFRRANLLEEAAAAEAAAGRPREAVQLRLRQLERMQEQLRLSQAKGSVGAMDTDRLRVRVQRHTETLIPDLGSLGMKDEMIEVLSTAGRTEEALKRLVDEGQEAAAAELARNAQEWELAAPILERLNRWGEASDVWELAGKLENAARCAERAGEDDRALQLYRSLDMPGQAAHCLARMGSLQDALIELHRAARLGDACEVLRNYPGPVPDIPDVILDMAEWAYDGGSVDQAISCLQRAVVGVALQPGRLDPAVGLARLLHEAGEIKPALAQLERVLAFDYSYEPAQTLKRKIELADRDPSQTHPTTERDARPAAPPAQQRYEILTELGRGGMGVVYKARDTRLERDVAIKVLRTTSKEEAARLEQEAKAAATLNHPGIVTVFDFEAGFDGYFITMEYVPGEALDQLMRTHRSRILEHLLPILVRLADAVAYAHSNQVIHRDLKPGNVLVTKNQEVKILDFGIAARLDTGTSAAPSVCGTPYYMAPEQIRGEPPTPATDIYAFGATAFHLATGQPPFKRGNVIDAHLKQPPPDPMELNPHLYPALARVILRCLEKKPKNRFASAADLRDELLQLP